ncbi:MAG TPA: hypothetical protein VJX67_01015 [Blastocatellia bacterium]|nr:hypothetical protein [Blastocatellia bacterium]
MLTNPGRDSTAIRRNAKTRTTGRRWRRLAFILIPWCLLLAQSFGSLKWGLHYDWGHKPEGLAHRLTSGGLYAKESAYFLRDRSLRPFLSSEDLSIVDRTEAWIIACTETSAIASELKPDIPMVNLDIVGGTDAFGGALYQDILGLSGKKKVVIAQPFRVEQALVLIRKRGFIPGEAVEIEVPFYSPLSIQSYVLIDALLPGESGANEPHCDFSWVPRPLDAGGFKARISLSRPLRPFSAGLRGPVFVTVTNLSENTWPARGVGAGAFQINLGNHWFRDTPPYTRPEDARTALPYDLGPGRSVKLQIEVEAPPEPGKYVLELDMVQEGVAWFAGKGSQPLRLEVEVR